jgi:glycine/sarcosine N-methyltransferase
MGAGEGRFHGRENTKLLRTPRGPLSPDLRRLEPGHRATSQDLNPLLAAQMRVHPLKILDCACGIGTQALGLAGFGHQVIASDLSRAEVNRAKYEAESRALDISFHVSDMTSLAEITDRDFDVVAAFDNALPHLTADQLSRAVGAVGSKLKSNGLFIASIRDYDTLILERPTMQEPAFYGGRGNRRIVHQVWDWIDDTRYALHLTSRCNLTRCGRRITLFRSIAAYCAMNSRLCCNLPVSEVRWVMPAESGFYQPLVLARRA